MNVVVACRGLAIDNGGRFGARPVARRRRRSILNEALRAWRHRRARAVGRGRFRHSDILQPTTYTVGARPVEGSLRASAGEAAAAGTSVAKRGIAALGKGALRLGRARLAKRVLASCGQGQRGWRGDERKR